MFVKNKKAILGFSLVVPSRDLPVARRVARVNKDKSSSSSASGIGGDLWWVVIGRKEGAKKKIIIKEIKRAIVGIIGVEVENIVTGFQDKIFMYFFCCWGVLGD